MLLVTVLPLKVLFVSVKTARVETFLTCEMAAPLLVAVLPLKVEPSTLVLTSAPIAPPDGAEFAVKVQLVIVDVALVSELPALSMPPLAVPAVLLLNEELLTVSEALESLAACDLQKAELVKLRYFVGLTLEETAEVLGISDTMAKRHWAYARAWLLREIRSSQA